MKQRAFRGSDSRLSECVETVRLTRFASGRRSALSDSVAREEPLEIQIGGTSFVVVMRTPGHDEELALGLLLGERVIARRKDVLSIRHSTVAPTPEAADNILLVTLAPNVKVDWERLKRNLYASASCGICGKATIESALAVAPPLDDSSKFAAAFFKNLPDRLRAGQVAFSETGGLHAAGLFDPLGELLVVREDIGRHNAVDKVIGWAAENGRLLLEGHVLMVSGRISYEIAQKALAARIPVIAAVSAPSSLAVELAEQAHMTLVGFLRDGDFNVYGNRDRVDSLSPRGEG